MLPKFRKPTFDFRYIASGIKSNTKQLPKNIINGVLTLVDNDLLEWIIINLKVLHFSLLDSSNEDDVTPKLNYLMHYAK